MRDAVNAVAPGDGKLVIEVKGGLGKAAGAKAKVLGVGAELYIDEGSSVDEYSSTEGYSSQQHKGAGISFGPIGYERDG